LIHGWIDVDNHDRWTPIRFFNDAIPVMLNNQLITQQVMGIVKQFMPMLTVVDRNKTLIQVYQLACLSTNKGTCPPRINPIFTWSQLSKLNHTILPTNINLQQCSIDQLVVLVDIKL
jgi:hypothetical protein